MTKFKKVRWDIKHSETKTAFNIIGTNIGSKYKIARVPYLVVEHNEEISEKFKKEAEEYAKLIVCAPELLEMLEVMRNEFNLAQSELRTQRNISIKLFGEKLNSGEIHQSDYNDYVEKSNLETKKDQELIMTVDQLIKEATE